MQTFGGRQSRTVDKISIIYNQLCVADSHNCVSIINGLVSFKGVFTGISGKRQLQNWYAGNQDCSGPAISCRILSNPISTQWLSESYVLYI